jgi:signal transduction histidine kinase
MREFTRQDAFQRRRIHINQPIRNALLITEQQLLNMQVVIEKDLDDDLPEILGDANRLEQVFLDIIANSRDAMEGQERERVLHVRSYASELDGRPAVAVEITDTGPGIPLEIRDKIFEPFFTTKEVGKGTGLGLLISFSIVEEHKGRIEVQDPPGGGTSMIVLIPVEQPGTSKDEDGGEA